MAKRFYENVAVEADGAGYVVKLDGRVLKTPGKMALSFARKNHANLVAAEWQAQGEDILPNTMPCTRMMNVACEQTPTQRSELVKEFRAYTSTDLLCYRSHNPKDLAARQEKNWQPILDYVADSHGIALATTTGIKAVEQPEKSLNNAADYAQTQDDTDLTLLLHFTASLGSAVLALSIMERRLHIDTAFALSRLDEIFQNERWGADDEAVENNRSLLNELSLMAQLIEE
ncbi:MAG: ATPase [Robiginitomaculum sp.]|nr:MAG: ATPase [Robiginitomaculum sp.]